MTFEEHVAAVQAALEAAQDAGYLLQAWPHDYNDLGPIDLMFIKNKRGADGIMRVENRARIETVYI